MRLLLFCDWVDIKMFYCAKSASSLYGGVFVDITLISNPFPPNMIAVLLLIKDWLDKAIALQDFLCKDLA